MKKKKKRMLATKPFNFEIRREDIQHAKRRQPDTCVIARAVLRCDPTIDEVYAGPRATKVVKGNKVISYRTSGTLAFGLKMFDETGKWPLPPGKYTLNVPSSSKPTKKRKTRTARLRKPSGKVKASATRYVPRVDWVASA